jgi:hypothetical protein
MDYAFMMDEEPRFMLRVPFIGVGAELEILPYFTLMAQAGQILTRIEQTQHIEYRAELRWYSGSRKKGYRNMSGNYFGAGWNKVVLGYPWNDNSYSSNFTDIYARWGMQRRAFGSGLIDLGMQGGFRFGDEKQLNSGEVVSNKYRSIVLSTNSIIGFGFVFNSEKNIDWKRICPITKCNEIEQFMVKANIANLFQYEYRMSGSGSHIIDFNPKIAVEYKLFKSSWSVNAGIDFIGKFTFSEEEKPGISSEYASSIESRWYYNLRSRMLSGKTGNGFSANYLSGGVRNFNNQSLLPFITTGIQRTLGNHLYFDGKIGFAMEDNNNYNPYLMGDLQVGFRF